MKNKSDLENEDFYFSDFKAKNCKLLEGCRIDQTEITGMKLWILPSYYYTRKKTDSTFYNHISMR